MVSVIAACCALVANGGAAAAAAVAVQSPLAAEATGTWGDAATVGGLPNAQFHEFSAGVSSVSCTGAGDCSAGGSYGDNSGATTAFVVDETGGVWGKARVIPGTAGYYNTSVTSVSCASPGNCSAGGTVGDYTGADAPWRWQAYVVNETGGVWGTAEIVPGTSALNVGDGAAVSSLSCTALGDCTAGGYYDTSPWDTEQLYEGFVVDETNGVWGTAHSVPRVSGLGNTTVNSVSCASPGNCAVGGADYTSNYAPVVGQAFVLDETDGVWGSAQEVPGTAALNVGEDASVDSVSCSAVGDCTAGGYYNVGKAGSSTRGLQAFVVDETGGSWAAAHEVPGTAALNAGADAQVTSVSCASPGNCAVGGTYAGNSTALAQQAFIVNETGGTWGKAEDVPGTAPGAAKYDSEVTSVSCASPDDCSAGGYDDGTVGYGSEATGRAFVIDESGGTWGTAQEVPGMTAINTNGYLTAVASVSCVSATDCAAGGSYGYTGVSWPNADAFVVDKSVHEPTATAVTVSAPRVVYGAEQAEHVAVKVTADGGPAPVGTVTVKSGSTTVCTITLSSGRGSCALTAERFPVGRVNVAASYRGTFVFGASASTAGFTVSKAGTRTSLKLSAAKVTDGHEQSERLSVTVSPKYAGPAGGKATIKAGKTAICVITLKLGKGTCTLTARKLRVGRYALTAAYPGSADYASSASTRKTLTIAR
jgi:Bacterial Ig-like domain (group 3)